MTIKFRNFTEIEQKIFINNNYTWVIEYNNKLYNEDGVIMLINEARNRVTDLFNGELQSDPVFIVSDNYNTIRKTGDRHTYTVVLHDVFTFIAISYKYLNVDILAHEMVHAELNHRVLQGKPFRQIDNIIPAWFQEGLASIVDYRDIMSKEALQSKTDIIDVTNLTRNDFQINHVNDPFFNALIIQEFYLFSKHKIKSWLENNGIDALFDLIDGVRSGKDFLVLYYHLARNITA
jgi:hypothetical protein